MAEKRETRQCLTRWSDSHVLLAVHHKASHGLTIWVVGSSLTYCRRTGEGTGQWSISPFNKVSSSGNGRMD